MILYSTTTIARIMNHVSFITARSANNTSTSGSSGRFGGVVLRLLRSSAATNTNTYNPAIICQPHLIIRSSPCYGFTSYQRFSSIAATPIVSSTSHPQTSSQLPELKTPRNVELWEELAAKELSKSSMTVNSLRTERITPVRI